MTKIDHINETVAIQATKKPNTPAAVPFSASLENALAQEVPDNTDRGEASALCEPQPPIGNQPRISSTDAVRQTGRLLGLLECYAAGLENPGVTLKELASIVTTLKDEAMQLMSSTDMLAAGESGINDIAAKAALTANVEYIKFQRGDYI